MIRQIRRITNMLPHPVCLAMRGERYYTRPQTSISCGRSVRVFLSHGGGLPVVEGRKAIGGRTRTQINKMAIRVLQRTALLYPNRLELLPVGRRLVCH